MPLTKIQSLGITDGTIAAADIASGAITAAKLASGVGGKVLQVVTATDSTARSTTSTSFVTASNTLSVSITPSSASNKIFIITSFSGSNNTGGYDSVFTIYRGATNIGDATDGFCKIQNGTGDSIMPISMTFLDSPSSTSSLTYQVYGKSYSTGTTWIGRGETGSITAIEIAG